MVWTKEKDMGRRNVTMILSFCCIEPLFPLPLLLRSKLVGRVQYYCTPLHWQLLFL
jgi:hypothetical protein